MRGTKAKLLRGLAAVDKKETQKYEVVPHTVRDKTFTNLLGEVVAHYKTATWRLIPSRRHIYKTLKAGYKMKTYACR